jgi:hypothetical protein
VTAPVRAMAAFGLAFFLSCLGFAIPKLHWFFYLPGIFMRRLMVLVGLKVAIPGWTVLGLEFGTNVAVLFSVIFVTLSVFGPRRAG